MKVNDNLLALLLRKYFVFCAYIASLHVYGCIAGTRAIVVCFCVWTLCSMVLRTSSSSRTLIRCRHLTVLITLPRFIILTYVTSLFITVY